MRKIHLLIFVGTILLLVTFINCSKKTNREIIHNFQKFKQIYADPLSEYRSAPLWDCNEQISKEGIDFQMKEFKKAGIGGVIVHFEQLAKILHGVGRVLNSETFSYN